MTKQRTFKRRVRERMAKTGESYTAARRMLIALPGAALRVRTATAPRTARYDWEDGSTRVVVGFDAMGEAKSRVAVSHERLPDADAADEMKSWWRERLAALKPLLEGGEIDA